MAVDMFMKLGDIKGESVGKNHKDSIDVLAWSWGLSNSGSMHSGTGGGSGKVNVQDLSFTKYLDKASPALILAGCNGKHYPQALLTVQKAGETAVEYLKITLKDVLVTSVSTGGSGGEDRLTENVTLNFAEFKFEYTPQTDKGAKAAGIDVGWDIAQNVKV
jgi:type VI secretion system secreted protein Hcp